MAKQSEILNGIHQRINESITGFSASPKDLGLKRIINESLSANAPEVLNILQKADNALREGLDEKVIVRPLLENLTKYESLFECIKSSCSKLRVIINENLDDINLAEMFECIENDSIREFIGGVYENYCMNKSLENRASLVSVLESVCGYDKNAARLMSYVKDGVITNNTTFMNPYEGVNESQVIDYKGQKFIQDENGQLHAVNATTMEKIYENVDNYVKELVNKAKEKEEIQENRSYKDITTDLHLYEHVRTLQKKYPTNINLQNVLSEYASALQAGCREEMLYETFCQRMTSGFDYLNPVEESVKMIQEAAEKSKMKCNLIRILEVMSNSNWAHLVPVIEGYVVDYMENPNPQTRNILINHLRMYESCPFVVDIILDVNTNANYGGENALPETFSYKDRNRFVTEHAHTETVYSPVQYVKENECIFNVSNQFYVKKGHSITKLSKDAIKNLSENFVALSILVNDPHVEINEAEDKIYYYTADKTFEINESVVKIDDRYFELDELKNLSEMHMTYPDMDDVNILTAAFLLENFHNIAPLDFVTRIAMNENNNKTLDLFKVKKNIFVSSHDNVNEEHVFYRGVTPLQLKNIINEHFGMNVSNLFEDLMPNQDKIVSELNELRNEYENKINSLLEMRQEFQTLFENAETEEDEKSLKESISDLTVQINEAKKDYKKFQKKADEIENGKEEDNDAPVLNEDKPKKKKSSKKVNEDDEDFSFDGDDDTAEVDDFNFSTEDEDGSDFDYEFDEFDGSEYIDDDEYTTSDGDDMTQSVESFETDPFDDEDGSDFDFSANGSQDDDYNLEGFDEFGQPVEDVDDFDINDTDVLDAEDDPYGAMNVDDEVDDEMVDDTVDDENGVVDAVTGEAEQRTDDTADDADLDYANFKIVKVDFDVNVRTGEKRSTGKVIVVEPWIDDFGNKTSQTKTIPFYVTDIQGEKGAVLNTSGMSVEMYNAVTSAIKSSADFQDVEVDNKETEDFNSSEISSEEDLKDFSPMDDEVFAEPFDSGSDETTVLTMDDGIEPRGVEIPTYQSGETEIELPANNVSLVGEESPIIDIIGESAKYDTLNNLFEDVDEISDEVNSDSKLVTAVEQEDPIAVIEDVLISFSKEVNEGGASDVTVEVAEIEDFDIDGTDVSSIKAFIGENEYAFFSLDDKVYSCLAEDFDLNSEDIETLREFVESDNENLAVCESENTEAVVELVTDIISIETGEDFTYDIEGVESDEVEVEESPNSEYDSEINLEKENF